MTVWLHAFLAALDSSLKILRVFWNLSSDCGEYSATINDRTCGQTYKHKTQVLNHSFSFYLFFCFYKDFEHQVWAACFVLVAVGPCSNLVLRSVSSPSARTRASTRCMSGVLTAHNTRPEFITLCHVSFTSSCSQTIEGKCISNGAIPQSVTHLSQPFPFSPWCVATSVTAITFTLPATPALWFRVGTREETAVEILSHIEQVQSEYEQGTAAASS